MQHGPGLPWALGSAQITHTGVELPQVLNCQDGCQTNSRRYDDLLSTDSVEHVASFLPTVLSVEPLVHCFVCLSVVVCLSVCDVLYCGKTVRPSEKVSEGVNRKPGSKS